MLKTRIFKHPAESPTYKLTLHVKNWIDGTPAKFIPIEVIQKSDFTEKRITLKKTNKDGVVIFVLPAGRYECQVSPEASSKRGIFGATNINLTKDSDIELNVEWMPIN